MGQEVPDSVNLINNPSFEEFSGKLKRLGSIDMATGWSSPTEVKADLFSESVKDAPVSAPRNALGDQTALTGTNYAGVLWWSYGNKEPRSYLQTKFKKSLKKGQKYCVRYYVSLSDLSKYSTAEHGVFISKMLVKKNDEASLTYKAQVPTLKTRIYDDQFTWQGVCGVYEAQGDENYLIIGNFQSTDGTNNEKVKRPKGENRPQTYSAYYYIDDVSVWPIKNMRECKCEQIDEAESEFIYGRKFTANSALPPAQRLDQIVLYFKRFHADVDASMQPVMEEMVSILTADPTLRIRLIGNTDSTEADRVRMRPDLTELGKDRASMVKQELVKAGIAAERITITGVANKSPADVNTDEVAQSKNRRVEVELE